MSGNKHINKLATQIVKKQEILDGYIDAQIVLARKNLQAYLDSQAREEKEIEELKKQQEDIKNHKAGRLAKVSLYEFVNDWVRPEISFKIFSYLGDPHKDGINKVRTHRRSWGINHRNKRCWKERKYYPDADGRRWNNEIPYCELPLYKKISSPFYKKNPADERAQYTKMSEWVSNYGFSMNDNRPSFAKLRNTNPLLKELWDFHQTMYAANGNLKFTITKSEIKKYLTRYKVSGRTDLTYGVKCSEISGTDELYHYVGNTELWLPPRARQELVGALMKL